MQQETGEERIVAKSKPTLNLVSQTAASSFTAPSSSASNRPGIFKAPSRQGSNLMAKGAAGGPNQNDAASSSQVWLSDAKTNDGARKLAAVDTNQDLSFQECVRKLAAENSEIIVDDDSKWPNNYLISRAYVPHLEHVHSNLRQQLKRSPKDKFEDLDVNTLIWGMFMTVTEQAAVHVGNDYLDNLHSTPNQSQRTVKQLFDVKKKLVGQGSQRNPMKIRGRLATKIL